MGRTCRNPRRTENRLIDQDGTEWLPVQEAARRLRVRPSTIWNWTSRNKVRAHRFGRTSHIHMGDATEAEHAWRQRVAAKKFP